MLSSSHQIGVFHIVEQWLLKGLRGWRSLGTMLKTSTFDYLNKINYNYSMSYSDEFLENITIDVCKKTFMLYMDDGQKRKVKCDTSQQFMDVLELINKSADPRIVEYTDITTTED